MSVSVSCPGCKASMKVRDDFAGKKVKCPRCATVLIVPTTDKDLAPVEEVPDDRIRATPGRSGKPRRPADAEEDRPRGKGRVVADDEEEDEAEDRPRKRKRGREEGSSRYKPCPRCDAAGARRVMWTAWGSFYGPALLTHVRCRECGHCYNGKSGGSNVIPAILFVSVPLLGILAIFGGLFYVLHSRGYF